MSENDSVLAVNQAFYDSIESADIDLMGSVWSTRSDANCVHPGAEPVRGKDAIMRSWAMVMASIDYVQFFLTEVNLAIAPGAGDPNIAVVTCIENILSGAASDNTFAGGKAVATNIFVRQRHTWQLWMHHGSPVAIVEQQ